MEKIKFDFEKQKNRIVKFGKNKIEIRPYVLTTEKIAISDMCCQQLKSEIDENTNSSIHTAKIVFDIIVTALCTNIEIPGVEIKYKKDKFSSVVLDLKSDFIEYFERSGIVPILEENIDNYKGMWEDTKKDIELSTNNITKMFSNFQDIIPSGDKQEEIVRELKTIVNDFNKKNPKIAKEVSTEAFRKTAKQDLIKYKNKPKQDNINNKK